MGLAAAFAVRVVIAGKAWGAPADILAKDGAMGPDAILLNWLAGVFAAGNGCYALVTARKPGRFRAWFLISGPALMGIGVLPFMGMRSILSPDAPREIASRARPVVQALAAYQSHHGEYPASIGELVPRYLPHVPSMGYGNLRELQYYRAASPPKAMGSRTDSHWQAWVGDEPFALVVTRLPRGTLIYRPSGRYDDLPGGKRILDTSWGSTWAD